MRVLRIPFSTNVERVALALAFKGLTVEWVDVAPADRRPVRELSGQELVPVLVDGGTVVTDSRTILRYLEERVAEPPLFPLDTARRAELDVFLDWFDRVWKGPPNAIERERASPTPDERLIERLGSELADALDLFERLLDGRNYLFGDFSVADCAAFPFLKYAIDRNDADDEPFHAILREFQPLGDGHSRLRAWIGRVDARPRA